MNNTVNQCLFRNKAETLKTLIEYSKGDKATFDFVTGALWAIGFKIDFKLDRNEQIKFIEKQLKTIDNNA